MSKVPVTPELEQTKNQVDTNTADIQDHENRIISLEGTNAVATGFQTSTGPINTTPFLITSVTINSISGDKVMVSARMVAGGGSGTNIFLQLRRNGVVIKENFASATTTTMEYSFVDTGLTSGVTYTYDFYVPSWSGTVSYSGPWFLSAHEVK